MDAAPILTKVAELLNRHGLEAVTVSEPGGRAPRRIAFAFRRTPANLAKLYAIGRELHAVLWRQLPDRGLFQSRRDDSNAHMDFIVVSAAKFEALQGRASATRFGGHELLIAATADRREFPADSVQRMSRRPWAGDKDVRELPLHERIRRWQALPPERRTNFLRFPVGDFGSWL